MQRRKIRLKVSNKSLRAVVDEIGPEDGVDPRLDAKARARQHRRPRLGPPANERTPGRKARQLGRQVAETLDALLAGEAADDLLRGLRVVDVVPAPDTSRLLVTLAVDPALDGLAPTPAARPADRLARLDQASGWLRSEVAAAICRKRVPALAFRLTVAEAGPQPLA